MKEGQRDSLHSFGFDRRHANEVLISTIGGACGRIYISKMYGLANEWQVSCEVSSRDFVRPTPIDVIQAYYDAQPIPPGTKPECSKCMSEICQGLVGARPALAQEFKDDVHGQ